LKSPEMGIVADRLQEVFAREEPREPTIPRKQNSMHEFHENDRDAASIKSGLTCSIEFDRAISRFREFRTVEKLKRIKKPSSLEDGPIIMPVLKGRTRIRRASGKTAYREKERTVTVWIRHAEMEN